MNGILRLAFKLLIWVMDPAVQTIASSIGMSDYVLDAVRSIDGVKYAVPLYSGAALVKLRDGTYQAVTIIGLDDASLFGWPKMKQGASRTSTPKTASS
ncbi:hypothetical protein B0G77_6839 [Paraburkholderia sp. BL10I2N1]|nr:hypothetical protein B0G77_6839 [Paraburkholderia sp. BL10I2N1]